jgi:hypothetical protein
MSSRGRRSGSGAASVLLLAVFAALAALELGLVRVRIDREVATSDLSPAGGLAWNAACEIPGSDAEGFDSTLEVLEDGHPLGPGSCGPDAIATRGGGRFRHWAHEVELSTSDGTDPRANGRRYELRHDLRPGGWLALAFALALATNLEPARRLAHRLDRASPGSMAAAVILAACVFRALVLVHHGRSSLGPGLAKGSPVSDGLSWYTLATEWASGRRWDQTWDVWSARRPLYWLTLGAVFSWTGSSVLVAQLVNVAATSLAAGAAFDGVRRLSSPVVGLCAALAQTLDPADTRSGQSLL